MNRVRAWQLVVVGAFVALLEVLCAIGVIDRVTMPPPHRIAADFVRLMASGRFNAEILKSLGNVLLAFAVAYGLGVVVGTLLHSHRAARDTLDPLFAAYYAIPIFAFYPLFIVIFGLGDGPQVLIGSSRQFDAAAGVEPAMLSRMLARAVEYMPGLAECQVLRTWTGFRAASPDKLPLVGPWLEDETVFLATGHEGLGITTSLATAELLACCFESGEAEIPLEPYLPARVCKEVHSS